MKADLSKLKGQALRDAEWVLSFDPGTEWAAGPAGSFRPKREAELIKAGVLVPTDRADIHVIGERP